jgi:DNA-directed RNA polymerase subunit RPC12/RpoP
MIAKRKTTMALFICKTCGKEISNEASACPGCGAKVPKKTKVLTWAVAGVIGLLVVLYAMRQDEPAKAAAAPRQPDKQSLQAALAREGAVELRKAMRDPDSLKFEFIGVNDDASVACFKYQSKNGFGGMNTGLLALVQRKVMVSPQEYAKHCSGPLNDWTGAQSK